MCTPIFDSALRSFSFRKLSAAGLIAGCYIAALFGCGLIFSSVAEAQDRYLPPDMPRNPRGAAGRSAPQPPPPAARPSGPTATVTAPPPSATEANQPVTGESLLRLFTPEEPARVGTPAASGTSPSGSGTSGSGSVESAPRFQPGVGGVGQRPVRGGNDPTAPGPDLQKLMGRGDGEQRSAGPPPLPEISLRARVFARNKPPVAIIDVGGKQLSVRKGSTIQVPLGEGGGAVQLRVLELDAGELHIQVVDREQVIILN